MASFKLIDRNHKIYSFAAFLGLELRSDPRDVVIDGGVDPGNALRLLVVAWDWPERGHALQVHQVAAALKQGNSVAADTDVGTCRIAISLDISWIVLVAQRWSTRLVSIRSL